MQKSKRKLSSRKYSYTSLSILSLILIVGIVPLVVRLKAVPLEGASAAFKVGQEVNADFFSYYKMVWFIVFTSIGTAIFLIKYFFYENIYIKKTNIYYPMIVYTAFVILSTIFATHRDVALQGFMDRYENMYVLIGYMLCLLLAINMIDNEKQVKYLLYTLGVSSIILSVIGIFQYAGYDLFASDFGKSLIVPSRFADSMDSMKFQFGGSKRIYGTLFNPNYVGVYMSIIFPLSATMLILAKDVFTKVFFGIVSILSLINLFGSGSRTGIISLGLYIVLLIVIFRSLIIKRWKASLVIIALLGGLFYGANQYTDGLLQKRLLAVKDSIGTVQVNSLKDINLEDNRATIAIEDYEINISYDDEGYHFKNENNDDLEITEKENKITFAEEPYNQHVFTKYVYEGTPLLRSQIRTNIGWRNFDLVVDDGEFKFLGSKGELSDLEKAPSWGFKGRERMASSRGYIWSRSLPLFKDTFLLGYGPDTYALHFPNDDYFGKLIGMSRINILVDKPHNYYIQTGINTGVISLIAVLAIFFMYIVSSIKLYIDKKDYGNLYETAGISIFFAVCSYLMVSVLNDSVISVAPVFWILLGTGIGINIKLKKERIENK
ncbi:O-antigen ligase family protein [Schnuerera sp. xch1]|uniref:O-antigen ligase family protein n=1 Tax=Schnuerera sp. xch1 TaxID=2874283 RepID=UPI001CC04B17|nr:O-antigen ligase family protein [Schnuerera sp. xch1]MBZ2175126.1 O-antigen ligase family protein [Schnuerera sp. xch1]